jgi:hypothetical protein
MVANFCAEFMVGFGQSVCCVYIGSCSSSLLFYNTASSVYALPIAK